MSPHKTVARHGRTRVRVLFLGAGASAAAGYPLGTKLLVEMEQYFRRGNVEANARQYWRWFQDAQVQANAPFRLLWRSSNPEVIASWLDLCVEALSSDDDDIEAEAERLVRESLPSDPIERARAMERGSEAIQARYDDPDRQPYVAALRARVGFLHALATYLRDCHFRDSRESPRGPDYLRDRMSTLQSGDVVVTTNYDSLAERCLLAIGLWFPSDGYGFDVPLTSIHPSDLPAVSAVSRGKLPVAPNLKAKVKVLKLHGSVGWMRHAGHFGPAVLGRTDYRNQRLLYLDQHLLRGLPWETPFFDSREPPFGDPGSPEIVPPTFFKRTKGNEFREVWAAAGEALTSASDLEVIGASLPASDAGVRALLTPLRSRVRRRDLRVVVQVTSEAAYENWCDVLGDNVAWNKAPFGQQ